MASSIHQDRPLIGLAVETSTSYGRQVVRGVMRYAVTDRRWRFMEDFRRQLDDPMQWAHCDGIITDARPEAFIRELRKRVRHVVSCSGGLKPGICPTVSVDEAALGELAANHLCDLGIKHFAFYPLAGRFYTLAERRFAGFRNALAKHDHACTEFRAELKGPVMVTYAATSHRKALVKWLNAMPKPLGVLTTDDYAARDLLAVCADAGIAVPDDITILGINNDELYCETSFPTLSSVDCGFERLGFAAAELLHQSMNGQLPKKPIPAIHFAPRGIVPRASTEVLAVDDSDLAEALRYIREHACDPCNVKQVVSETSISRRKLEKKCLAQLGTTLHDQIITVRLKKVRTLLLRNDLDIDEVAQLSGFSTTQLNRVFKKEVGQTPSDWRQLRAKS